MTTPIRNARGQFIPKNNPLVVIGALQTRLDQQREAERRKQEMLRLAAARKRGYYGPLTRNDLITPDAQAGAW
jgi:hypothetical protein